ncbi:sodium:proton antiporter, partial [Parageobacillus sp. SY1]
NLDLRALLAEPKILTLLPLLLLALVVSKLIPVSILKIWYDTKTTVASGFLLVSTLSLVIAAATIAERINVIDENMKGALILVAVISSIVSPIVFKKLYAKPDDNEEKINISFVGTNQFTLSVAKVLNKQRYDVTLYHIRQEKIELPVSDHVFPIVDIEDYSLETLEKHGAFTADILVALTGNEEINTSVALAAKERGIERVIALAETPKQVERLKAEGIEIMSALLSTTAMLQAFIESPRVARMFINKDATLHEMTMNNNEYDGIPLRRFPFMGDCIIVRIFRENESIVPHGDTKLHKGDRLIVTGSNEYVAELRELLE